jgi:hypothetical protein
MDIPVKPDDPTLGLDKVRKESRRWWKWYFLYSAIAVQEINVITLECQLSQLADARTTQMRLVEVDRPASRVTKNPSFRLEYRLCRPDFAIG